ncbi:MAG: hypothetical protein RIQ52_1670 [Pseudomonadota bacterium]|jgi:putative FmdB family regulatory protein
MPTYDYHCQSCETDFTAMHKISDPIPECPACHSSEIAKKISAPAVMGAKAAAPSAPAPAHGCAMGGCGCRPH